MKILVKVKIRRYVLVFVSIGIFLFFTIDTFSTKYGSCQICADTLPVPNTAIAKLLLCSK